MPNLISMATTKTVALNQVGLVIFGLITFVVAIRWLVSSAKIIDKLKIATSLKNIRRTKP
jgi:hypothetical protein